MISLRSIYMAIIVIKIFRISKSTASQFFKRGVRNIEVQGKPLRSSKDLTFDVCDSKKNAELAEKAHLLL